MKASDMVVGKTYVGKNGKRRCITRIVGGAVVYDKPEGGTGWCQAWTFARWVEREATAEESAP